jgi:hypothetical protein
MAIVAGVVVVDAAVVVDEVLQSVAEVVSFIMLIM